MGNCVSLLPFMVDLQIEERVSAYLARLRRELGDAQGQSSFTLVHLLENLRLVTPAPGISLSLGRTHQRKENSLSRLATARLFGRLLR